MSLHTNPALVGTTEVLSHVEGQAAGLINQATTTHTTGLINQGGLVNQGGLANQGGLINQGGLANQGGLINQGGLAHQGITNTTGHGAHGHNVIGTVTFRPLEGKFVKDKDIVGKMDPYCKIKIGWHSAKSSVAKSEGTHPTWTDVMTLQRKHGEQFAKLKCKDRDRVTLNDNLGSVKINLDEIAAKGRVQQWFPLTKADKVTGEVLVDIEYISAGTTGLPTAI